MSTFYLYQPVRIVRSDNWRLDHLVGVETIIAAVNPPGYRAPYMLAALGTNGLPIGAWPEHLEPVRHDPDAIDLMTVENAPSFDCPVPVAA